MAWDIAPHFDSFASGAGQMSALAICHNGGSVFTAENNSTAAATATGFILPAIDLSSRNLTNISNSSTTLLAGRIHSETKSISSVLSAPLAILVV
jgi:hypothetical protein